MKRKSIVRNLLIVGLIAFFVFGYIRQIITMHRIEYEINNKQLQLEEIKTQNERLNDEVKKINEGSLDYIEKLARERLGMIKPNEKVVNDDTKDENASE